jgi:hypothetical protein
LRQILCSFYAKHMGSSVVDVNAEVNCEKFTEFRPYGA